MPYSDCVSPKSRWTATRSAEYGIPFAVVPADQKRLPLAFGTDGADYSSESDRGPVPVPPTAPVEGDGRSPATATSSCSSAGAAC